MAYIGKTPVVGNFQVCDAISVVNGQAAYTLQVGGVNVSPESANHMLVSLNGVLQKPGSSFTISGSTMTFASNLATGDVIDFVQILGNVLDLGTPSDGTVATAKLVDDAVTAAKINNDIISGSTELAAIPSGTDELLISDAGTLKRIDTSFFQNTPAFLVRADADQSIASTTHTKLTFGTVTYNIGSDWDTSNNYFKPTVAGTYFLHAMMRYDTGTDFEYGDIQIRVNGSTYIAQALARNEYYEFRSASIIYEFNGSSDYAEVYTYQNSGSNQDAADGSNHRYFMGYKLIGA